MIAIQQYLKKHGFAAFCPKAVLFDMDGVLYDSMPNHAVAWQKSMAQFNLTMTALDAYATEGARGVDTITRMVRLQQGRDISTAEAQRMYDLKSQLFHDMPEPPVMPGVKRLMQQATAAGFALCVVTGSGQRPLINRLMKDFGDYLSEDRIVTAYDVSRGKPAPDPYLMGLQRVGGLQPWQAIVVENAPLGIRAGVAARIFTVAVNTGPLPDEQLLCEGADILFNSMDEFSNAWSELIL